MARDDFMRLKELTDRIGQEFGTEDFCLLIYALVKMQKPQVVVELGTGYGATAFWIAQAMKENGSGVVWTVDDGTMWPAEHAARSHNLTPEEWCPDQREYMSRMVERLGLGGHLKFLPGSMPPFPGIEAKVDLLFSDFRHGPEIIIKLMAHFLPVMADCSSILIDSAPTLLSSRQLLQRLTDYFNRGRIPPFLEEMIDPARRADAQRLVGRSKFTLTDLMERKDRAQSSTAWLTIVPDDLLPHPFGTFKFM